MKTKNINQQVFFELLRSGLWGNGNDNLSLNLNEKVDWVRVYQLAQAQSVQGIVLQGIEMLRKHNDNLVLNIPQALLLQWMNAFVADLIEKLRKENVCAILVKGQGVAQCYEKPLWRTYGDVDLLLNDEDYDKAKGYLLQMSNRYKSEKQYTKHLGLTIGSWYVELHGTLRCGLSEKVDVQIDEAQKDVFCGNVRFWTNDKTQIFIPSVDNDVLFIFTHILQHFYKETLGLKQLCDLCRLLWIYRESLNRRLLAARLKKAGLISEWKAFAFLAVEHMGMPAEAMPFIDLNDNGGFNKKAEKLMEFILGGYSGNKVKDTLQIAKIFPWKTLRYSPSIFLNVNWLKIRERLLK